MSTKVIHGECVATMAGMEPESFHAVVTDPPYEINFMSKKWDGTGVAFRSETWAAVARVLKPGGHLLAFGGTRTYHRLVCAIEDAGFEIRDSIMWIYASGFPKSRNLDGEWQGWGTALKPATEIICVARKPLSEPTVAANVLKHGTGALNIEACRVATGQKETLGRLNHTTSKFIDSANGSRPAHARSILVDNSGGARWPANVIHDGSPEVMDAFARFGLTQSVASDNRNDFDQGSVFSFDRKQDQIRGHTDSGTAARFFFTAKAASWEREGNHPTVKPQALMEWLLTLVTPPGGRVLDPFCGTGSTLVAADWLGIEAVGIEQDAKTCADAETKIRRLRARRMLGNDVKREAPVSGQLGLFG